MIEFSAKQKEVWRNTMLAHRRWNISLGATRSGKTYLDYYKIPQRIRRAPRKGLVLLLGNTQGTLRRNILDPLREIWTAGLVGDIKSDNKVMLFGRECYALGADKVSQVSKLQGSGLAYCYGDEVTTWSEPVFQMLKSRLDKPGSCFDGTCNPEGPNHWFKQFLESDADIYQMAFCIDDNPFLEPEFVEALKKEYAGTVYYDRYILGKWQIAEGLIYGLFDPEKHVCPTIGREYSKYYISCDYGTYNPTTFGLWGKFEDVWYRVKEYYFEGRKEKSQKTPDQYVDDLLDFISGREIERVIIDPSAAPLIAAIRNKTRLRVKRANNDVVKGIARTATALNSGKIKINDCCTHAITEFYTYAWDDKAAQRGEDKPIKTNDHCMDDIRYFVSAVLYAPRTENYSR